MRVGPVQLAGVLVEREDAVARARVVAPAERDAGDEDLVLVDRRRRRAAAEGRDHPELFGHLPLPGDLAGLAVEADRGCTARPARRRARSRDRRRGSTSRGGGTAPRSGSCSSCVPRSSCRCWRRGRRRSPACAGRRSCVPETFASPVRLERVDAALHDDRRGHAADRRGPEDVLAVGRPFLGQVRLAADAVLLRAAPLVPVARAVAATRAKHRQQHRRQSTSARTSHSCRASSFCVRTAWPSSRTAAGCPARPRSPPRGSSTRPGSPARPASPAPSHPMPLGRLEVHAQSASGCRPRRLPRGTPRPPSNRRMIASSAAGKTLLPRTMNMSSMRPRIPPSIRANHRPQAQRRPRVRRTWSLVR